MSNGRLTDVIVEDFVLADPRTGLEKFCNFEVWADPGLKNLIESIEGILYAIYERGKYHVYIDKRYDKEYVKQEIIARIKIGE